MKNNARISIVIILLSMCCFSVVYVLLEQTRQQQIRQTQNLLVQEAEAHFSTIKNLQIWHEKFGGVFKREAGNSDYHFSIYSLNPKNNFNKAVGIAEEALILFAKDLSRKSFYRFSENQNDFDFVGAMHVEKRCLQCHTQYDLGDVRGGIKINIPLDNYRDNVKNLNEQYHLWTVLLVVFFIVVTAALIFFITRLLVQKDEISALNDSLERKVNERTKEIQVLYSREHYLKDLLGNLSEINEALISSYSMSNIIQASVEKLNNHPNYRLMMFSQFDGKSLHIRNAFGDRYDLLEKVDYSLEELAELPLFRSTLRALLNHHWEIDAEVKFADHVTHRNRAEDYTLRASIALPMIDQEGNADFSILTLWTDREEGFDQEEIQILDSVANDIAMALSAFKQRQLSERLQKEQVVNYEETILAFVDMIEQRDAYTAGHTLRVAKYSRLLAEQLKIEERIICKIEKAAILHDIGKIATPDTILLKPGRLSSIEYDLIKQHVTAGYKMLSKVKMYAELAEIIKYHHEHFDGSGYPTGLKGDQIPLEAHILIVADAFDAMTTNRIYKPRLSVSTAISEIKRLKGQQFHPDVVDAALQCLVNVQILETSQLPQNELETQRFSYFFTDNLTGLYNLAYLKLVLNQSSDLKQACLIRLHNFSAFNRDKGWNAGDEVLISIAQQLRDRCSQSQIFRFEGDDFLVLSESADDFELDELSILPIDSERIVKIDYDRINAKDECLTDLIRGLIDDHH